MRKHKSYFITFEGAEGAGKSTQIGRAARYLKGKGYSVLVLREPGGTRIGEGIRKIILNKNYREMSRETELLLYLACRAQIVKERILPALQQSKIVICDRFEDSTLAYQGFGRKIPVPSIQTIARLVVRGSLVPDLTFILDLNPRRGLKRGGRRDRIERESYLFHDRVRRGFLRLAKRDPKRCIIINADQSVKAVAKKVKEALDRVF